MEMEIVETENLNLSTVFGLFIGYPVLYWFQGGAQASNCLDMIPLIVYEITCDVNFGDGITTISDSTQGNQTAIHTSSPSLCVTPSMNSNKPETSKDKTLSKRNHILYSFSVPECVVDSFDDQIRIWFQNLQDCCSSSSMITNFQLNQKTVTLPTVAL